MNIYEELQAASVPLSNHESDLYAKVTPESQVIIDKYLLKRNVTTFVNNIDGQRWFDIPFAFTPYWTKRGM